MHVQGIGRTLDVECQRPIETLARSVKDGTETSGWCLCRDGLCRVRSSRQAHGHPDAGGGHAKTHAPTHTYGHHQHRKRRPRYILNDSEFELHARGRDCWTVGPGMIQSVPSIVGPGGVLSPGLDRHQGYRRLGLGQN